jgi:hypothetical protein
MTAALTPIADATQRLAAALIIIPGIRISTNIASPISPPAVVIGPPRLGYVGEASVGGQPLTVQWSLYLVTGVSQYALDQLLTLVGAITEAVERYTPGVVLSSGPGTYPSPSGPLPCYITVAQMEVAMR